MDEYVRDWKTGNWYLYPRPAPFTPLWVLRRWIDEWWTYGTLAWRARCGDAFAMPPKDRDTFADQEERWQWVLDLPDGDGLF